MKCRPAPAAQSGFSLVTVMVAVAISGIVAAAIFQMLSNTMASQRHIELRDELRQVRNIISERISCTQTLPSSALAGCLGAVDASGILPAGPYLQIKDKNGKALGKLLADGSQAFGKWRVRGRCVKSKTANLLQLSTARFDAKDAIMKDPLTAKPLGWVPVYTADSPLGAKLCEEEILGAINGPVEAEHLEQGNMEAIANVAGCGDGLIGAILGGTSKLYRATITCPDTKIAVGGGAECMPGSGQPANIFQAIAGSPKGLMVASRPATNGQAWYVECCLKTGGILGIGGKFPAPKAYAVCIKDEKKKDP
jgi:hypothetical protein